MFKVLDLVMGSLLIAGGLNCGTSAITKYDAVGSLLGKKSLGNKIAMGMVGAGAIYEAARWIQAGKR